MSQEGPIAWFDVAARDMLATRRWMEVEAGFAAVLLFDLASGVHATDAVCPHHSAWLSQGGIDGEYVDCPRHMGRFHIPTGEQVRGPACDRLKTYPTKIEGGRVLVGVHASRIGARP